MICLLRSSAAALATHPRAGGGGVAGSTACRGGASRAFFHSFTNRGGADESSSCSDGSTALRATSRNFHDTPAPTTTTTKTTTSASGEDLLTSGHIAFRLARRTDVVGIQTCNLATLPENYNANFYINHMRAWPELTLVAEHIPEGFALDDEGDSSTITPLREYIRGTRVRDPSKPRKEIVGYILGKVEERPVNPTRAIFPPSRVPLYDDEEETLMQYVNGNSNGARFSSRRPAPQPMEKIGHVTSLAVHSHARRLGIASSLINQLHFHLKECYDADSIGLHVRISNKAAVALYCEEGYDVADIIPLYYGDGEDAYFMRKDFSTEVSEAPQQQVQQPPQRQLRRGEKERNEWLDRDATRSGTFFDNRKSMRDTLSEEERAWVNNSANGNGNTNGNNPQISGSTMNVNGNNRDPSLSGQFKRSLRTFFNSGGEPQMRSQRQGNNQYQLPAWEVGPEGLKLPRYNKVCRKEEQAAITTEARVVEEEEDDIEYYGGEEEAMSLDACVASGSV
jgi:ribosomal protein S18 acetylase RimI-like enzyme